MRKLHFSLIFMFCCSIAIAQKPESAEKLPVPSSNVLEQQLENTTANNDDAETEDDSFIQDMLQFQKNPINVNTADESLLKSLHALTPVQIQNLITYRNFLGKLIDIYELQAVPGWDIQTIQKVKAYISVTENADLYNSLKSRLKEGDHTILLRTTQVLEESVGYKIAPSSGKNYYQGSAQRLFLRYRYNYKNTLQYGFVGEKDAGEQFFKGAQKQGFDFYSAHIFARNVGLVKSLAIGDFTVNMGQGLIQWMSLAFKKGPDVLATKRQADVLRPYNSAGEINFHRGVGITVAKKNIEATLFASYKGIDANFSLGDSSQLQDDFVSSFQTSGYHRTKNEVADKSVQKQFAFGGNVAYRFKNVHIGLNAIQYRFKYSLQKQAQPYNLYALAGKGFGNYSTDYSYTYKNLHFFGEVAITDKQKAATINGLLISATTNVDMSFVYRNISKNYQSLYSNAFTESSYPTNEKGFFSGITIKPTDAWRLDGYVDMFKFPWLKFRINAPSNGADYLLQLSYKPNKIFEIYTRYKFEKKSINFNPEQLRLSPVLMQPRQNWRTHLSCKLNSILTFRTRTEMVWFNKNAANSETGFLLFADLIYNKPLQPFSANIRLQYFETEGYNSRLYAYENDVLFSYSIPVFYGKGYRYYINVNYDVTRKLTVWVKAAQFLYPQKSSIGSGLDLSNKSHKTEIKLQCLYKF